jgi:hypothetical protein
VCHFVSSSLSWDCQSGEKVEQCSQPAAPGPSLRVKSRQVSGSNGIMVDHTGLDVDDEDDDEDEVSEMVTRHVFTWLRGENGFPVAEREIREHEWIQNLESDDESPIEGDVRSTYRGNLGGWLLGTSTTRSNSI